MRVVVRRESSWFDALSIPMQAIVLGSFAVIAIAAFVPILIAIETKAFFARHRIRKSRTWGSGVTAASIGSKPIARESVRVRIPPSLRSIFLHVHI